MFDKTMAKLKLAFAAKAVYDSVGDPKMTPEKEYQLTIGLWKAIITFLKQFASCTTISAYMDGVVIPSTWDEFRAKWMTIAIPIIWGLVKVIMNAYKQGAFGGKAVASVVLVFALLVGSSGCASMSTTDKAALMSAAVASVTAAGVQVSAAIDAHKAAQQQRDIEAANAKIEQAQKQLDIAVGTAEKIKQIVTKPTVPTTTP